MKGGERNYTSAGMVAIIIAMIIILLIPNEVNASVPNYSCCRELSNKAKLIFTFDDPDPAISNLLGVVEPMLTANNQRAVTFFVMNTAIDSTATQLKKLQDAGWDISSHSMTHADLTTLSNDQLIYELNNSYDWLVNNGFYKSAGFFAYPYGAFDDYVIGKTKMRYLLARSATYGINQDLFRESKSNYYMLKVIEARNYVTVREIEDAIDATIAQKGLMILLFHTIVKDNPDLYFYKESDLQQISDYVKNRSSDIDVITFSDYLIDPDSTPTPNPTPTPAPTPTPIPVPPTNLISNPGFESGTSPWSFFTNGKGSFTVSSPGFGGSNRAAKIALNKIGSNIQLYQNGVTLEANTQYRLTFAAYSTYGNDVLVNLIRPSPYAPYGLSQTFNLNTSWQTFTTVFTTSGFAGTVNDGRFRFWFVGYAGDGETYYFDDVRLEKVTAPPSVPPAVVGNAPTGTNVPVTAGISVNFSKPMNQTSVQSAFSTVPATTGSFTWNGNNTTYIPVSNLDYNTAYNITIGTGAMDISGNNLPSSYTWQFTTIRQDLTPPAATGNSPAGVDVSPAAHVIVNFSEAMDRASVQSSFSIVPAIAGSFTWSGNNMTYTPVSNLAYDTTYDVIIGTGARDIAGNNMLSPYSWQFTTIRDTTPPSVTGNAPAGMNVPINSQITVTFSKPMNNSSAESAFSISPAIAGSFSWTGNTMKYTPASNLSYNTTYHITVGTGAKDLAGNNLSSSYAWQFATVPYSVNLIINPGFESGTASWTFYTSGTGTFGIASPGYEGNNAARLILSTSGTNIQLYQTGISLEPDTLYRLSFAAYSTGGNDVAVRLLKHVAPYTSYSPVFTANLSTGWSTFTTEFNTAGYFTGTVNDGRLMFWLSEYADAGDNYYIDNVRLDKV